MYRWQPGQLIVLILKHIQIDKGTSALTLLSTTLTLYPTHFAADTDIAYVALGASDAQLLPCAMARHRHYGHTGDGCELIYLDASELDATKASTVALVLCFGCVAAWQKCAAVRHDAGDGLLLSSGPNAERHTGSAWR